MTKRILMPDDKKARRSLEIRVPKEEVEKAEETVVKELRKKVFVPGFRPGRVPPEVIRRRYRDEIKATAIDRLIKEYVSKEIEARNAILLKGVEVVDLREVGDGELSISIEYEAMPRFDLPELSKIVVQKEIPKVTLEDINAEIERMRNQLAQFVAVERPSEYGDIVMFDLEVIDEKTGKVLQRYTDRMLELDSQKFADKSILPKFVGVKPGDIVEIKDRVEMQDESGEKKEVDAIFRYHIKSVGYLDVPPVDDELAKDFGYNDLNELREAVRKKLENEVKAIAEVKLEDEIAQRIMETVQFEVPPSFVEDRLNWYRSQMAEDEFANAKDYLTQLAQVKAAKSIIAFQVIEQQGIEVSDDEVMQELKNMSKRQGVQNFDEYLKKLKKDRKKFDRLIHDIKERIAYRKAWDYIKSKVKMEVVFK